VEQVPTFLVNDGKLKDPKDTAKAFGNLSMKITERH
jgi:hypothetical protein